MIIFKIDNVIRLEKNRMGYIICKYYQKTQLIPLNIYNRSVLYIVSYFLSGKKETNFRCKPLMWQQNLLPYYMQHYRCSHSTFRKKLKKEGKVNPYDKCNKGDFSLEDEKGYLIKLHN